MGLFLYYVLCVLGFLAGYSVLFAVCMVFWFIVIWFCEICCGLKVTGGRFDDFL